MRFSDGIERKVSKRLGQELRSEEGSAVVEFVLLALPLFIPITMYLSAVQSNSNINRDLHNLARQSARAFITSPSESYEEARMQSVVNQFVIRVFVPNGIHETPVLNVQCSATPCLTPEGRVKVTASIIHQSGTFAGALRFIATPQMVFSASDTQIVDAWR